MNVLKIVNYKPANEYMDTVCQESKFTSKHKGFTKVPHKILRCYGLSEYEKLILIDMIAYMSDKSLCYPTIETMARDVGCSSKSIVRHIRVTCETDLTMKTGFDHPAPSLFSFLLFAFLFTT